MSKIQKGDWLGTYSGSKIFPLDPDSKDIRIEDISCALSRICRFNGHTKRIYTVAEHCLNVELMLRELGCTASTCLYGLLHDAAEAYVCDIPRPLKRLLPGYDDIERKVQIAIYKALNLQEPIPEQVKVIKWADDYLLALEARSLMKKFDDWALVDTYAKDKLADWGDVQSQFLKRLNTLLGRG